MARYWVGGTAAWDGTAGTKWATTSGGAGGASIPNSTEDVFFDASSTGTCTISSGNTGAKSINCTGFTGTLAGSTNINVSGSVTLAAGMGYTYSGTISFLDTGTVTSAGKTFAGRILINGSGITVTLGDAFTTLIGITVNLGTFDTANYSVVAPQLSSSNSNVRTITLGSSAVTLNSASTAIEFTTPTNLTFNAGTSSITLTGNGAGINAPNIVFYNLVYNPGGTAGSALQILTAITCNNFDVPATTSAGVRQVAFSARCTINGTLSTTGTAGNRRVWFRSNTYGLAQTLTINATPSLTDADFRDIYVIGTAAPISGTRVGDLRGCRGITFDTPKNCYRIGSGDWSENQWSNTSGGSVSTDNFPLAQDTAIINQSSTSPLTLDTVILYTGAVDFSARTSAFTFNTTNSWTFYGSLTLGSGVTTNGTNTQTFSGRNTQTITSAGKTLTFPITVDSYGGSVELADALNIGSSTLTVTNGTFDTKSYNVTAGRLSSSGSGVRLISLGSSTISLSNTIPVQITGITNLTLSAGTSQINVSATGNTSFGGGTMPFYNLSYTGTTASVHGFTNSSVFNNITITAPASAGLTQVTFNADQTITGTLTVAGASPVRRIFVRSDTLGTTRTLTVGTLSADDCDFRDITIAGTAAGSSPTRAGDCGGNSGITFPAPKTVYFNRVSNSNWSDTAWAPSSGGTPDINNFPLAQDTAVFDDTGSAGTVAINAAWNIGTFDASARTSAMTLTTGSNAPFVYGDWLFGTGVTSSGTTGTITFAKRGTQTITSNGVSFGCPVTVDCVSGLVQLADALVLATNNQALTITRGTFDAVSYNVTASIFNTENSNVRTLKMGSGTWTISGTGASWALSSTTNLNFYKGTADIVLSDTSSTARTFNGGGLSYNKLTIGGTTGTSTLTITGNNQFTELASTKTVAHTIALGSTTQTFGKWSVTGTSGNVVTLTGTGTIHRLAGSCTDGIDYLAMGSIGFQAGSPAEFYAGANSTGTAGAPVYRTAKPADSVRYWVGGTGNWSDTARWSTSSGGASGASVPRSHDDVVFDSASNATAYTATVNAVTGGIRMKSLTVDPPASGTVTIAGSTAFVGIHGNVTLAAAGLTWSHSAKTTFSGSSTGLTLTTNGKQLNAFNIDGVGCYWTLGSALSIGGNSLEVDNGTIDFANYNLTAANFTSDRPHSRGIVLGSGTVTFAGGTPIGFGTTETNRANLTFTANTSQINMTAAGGMTFNGNNQTFYNVAFTNTNGGASANNIVFNGANSFNDLSFAGATSAGLKQAVFSADQTINGTLTCSAGTNATMRHFVCSDSLGTTRTLTCNAVSLTDVDFRDITIAGAAAPATGTRIGDCKGNSGITFDAAANKYWNLAAGGNWGGSTGWATSSGGTPAINNFPLAQDTCFFEATGLNSGATVTVNQSYNIGTIDMSARTTNTMTLATGSLIPLPAIYGNWINGTGTTLTGTSGIAFNGRTLQTITSAGKNFAQYFSIGSPGGTVRLLDALTTSNSIGNSALTAGTLDLNNYTYTGSAYAFAGSATKTLAIGTQSLVLGATGSCFNYSGSNLTVTGTGTISLTSASAKTFVGGVTDYSGITINQGGAGQLNFTQNHTFANITNTYSATGATTISFGTTTQRVGSFTATGEAGRVLTLTGNAASNPATLVLTSGTVTTPDYLTITGIRAYNLTTTWYAGANSTNNGSLGWYFEASGGTTYDVSFSDTATGADAVSASFAFNAAFSDTATGADAFSAGLAFNVSFSDTATGADAVSVAASTFGAVFSDTATGTDAVIATGTFNVSLSELATGTDAFSAVISFTAAFSDAATGADAVSTTATLDVSFSDTASGADAVSTSFAFSASFSDTASGADAFSAAATLNVSLSELATGADAFSAAATLNVSVSDAASGQDTPAVAASTFNASFSASATGQDTPAPAGSTFNVSLSETGAITDVVVGGYLWNPVDDTQSANWQNVVTAQSPGWVQINDAQGPNWVEIQT